MTRLPDIGEIVLHFEDNAFSKNPQLLYHMAEQCVTMVTKAIDSFINSDYDLGQRGHTLGRRD